MTWMRSIHGFDTTNSAYGMTYRSHADDISSLAITPSPYFGREEPLIIYLDIGKADIEVNNNRRSMCLVDVYIYDKL